MVTSTDIAKILVAASGKPKAEADMRSRLRVMTGVSIPKGKGGKFGAGAAPLSSTDGLLMILGMASDQAKDAGEHALELAIFRGPRGLLLGALEDAAAAMIEHNFKPFDGMLLSVRLPRMAGGQERAEVEWLGQDGPEFYIPGRPESAKLVQEFPGGKLYEGEPLPSMSEILQINAAVFRAVVEFFAQAAAELSEAAAE